MNMKKDFLDLDYSGDGDVTEAVTAVDPNLTGDRSSTSGCETGDFAAFPKGNIALIQRGTCTFRIKVDNAVAAGAAGVIIFNQGNVVPDEDRTLMFGGTLGPLRPVIPVVSTSFGTGAELASLPNVRMRLAVSGTTTETAESAGCPDGIRWSVRLLRVHQQRHSGWRIVHRGGGPEDRGGGGNLRRDGQGCP